MTEEERKQKAKQYDSYLAEHDKLAREVSLIKSNFNLTESDSKKIKELETKMSEIRKKSQNLGGYFG